MSKPLLHFSKALGVKLFSLPTSYCNIQVLHHCRGNGNTATGRFPLLVLFSELHEGAVGQVISVLKSATGIFASRVSIAQAEMIGRNNRFFLSF